MDMDSATAALILQLQIDDITAIQENNKGKGTSFSGDEGSDAIIAITLYQQELQDLEQYQADERWARSMTAAVQADEEILAACRQEEMQARQDRVLAYRLNGQPHQEAEPELHLYMNPDRCPEQTNGRHPARDVPDIGPAVGIDQGPMLNHRPIAEKVEAESSRSALKTEDYKMQAECSICTEHTPEFTMLQLSTCDHQLCKGCVRKLFQNAIDDESSFPPKCCQEISLNTARTFLTSAMIAAFEEAAFEYQTPERIYCAGCSLFIPPENVGEDFACCGNCGNVTCTHCKSEIHDGDCPKDKALQKLLETASDQGWKRCYKCERMVELKGGCFHIS